jgi:cobalt/nickel transport system permease protein
MHIPDGYLSPQTYVVLDAAMVPIWIVAARKVKRTLTARQIPLLALGSAFAFVIMMFNVPVIGGSTGHAVGATLIAIILGPWAAVIAVSIALVTQAFVFGDGGITVIGANCFNMAVVMPFVGFYLFRLFAGDAPSGRRRVVSSGVAAYVAIVAGAVCAGVEFGIQPYLAHTASGQALYAPYKLAVAVPAMALEHLLFFGWVEALATMGVVAVLARSDPGLLAVRPAARPLRWLWAGMAGLILFTPIGALTAGTAWGEWSPSDVRDLVGYVPQNLEKVGGLWRAVMPDYATPGVGNALLGYLIAAIVGVGITVGAAWGIGALLTRRGAVDAGAAPDGLPDARVVRRGRGRTLARRTADAVAHAVADVLENEEIATRRGLLQRLDPRIKLVSLLLFAVTASLVHSLWVLIALVGVTLALAAASRVSVASFIRRVWSSAGLLALLIAAPSATRLITPGPVAVHMGPLSLTEPGLAGAATLVVRVVACAGFALLVVWTARWSDLLRGLTAMGMPDVVVATLAMTQRQILSLLRTVEQIHLARESRTLTRGSTAENRAWVTERMAFVLRKSLKTADDVYDAMLSRGYTGAMQSLVRLRLGARDGVWAAACLTACAAAVLVDRAVMPR